MTCIALLVRVKLLVKWKLDVIVAVAKDLPHQLIFLLLVVVFVLVDELVGVLLEGRGGLGWQLLIAVVPR